jgi:Sulfotransferase domain
MTLPTSSLRETKGRLPNLLIVGVAKAGTGSLFSYLAQHPEICPATEKEIGFFDPLGQDGGALPPTAEYEEYFRHCDAQRYAMEATPSYCYGGRGLISGVREILERPRIVMILRDPVDRLWSAYTFQRSLGHLQGIESFDAYVAACSERRRQSLLERQNIRASGYLKGLAVGFYAEYVGDWLESFGDDVRIVFFDDLASRPDSLLADLCRWLGIDVSPVGTFDYTTRNATIQPRSMTMVKAAHAVSSRFGAVVDRSPRLRGALRSAYLKLNKGSIDESMRPSTRTHLVELYRESNLAVADMLGARGYELPPWLTRA